MTRPSDSAILLSPTTAVITRRTFVHRVGTTAAILAAGALLGDCGGALTSSTDNTPKGTVRGTVADLQGTAQSIGRVYLLQPSGLNTGTYVDVSGAGTFDFGQVPVGAYQLRYWGDNLADVPEPLGNPVHIQVTENQVTFVQFQIVLGGLNGTQRDIYAGDFFFQEQPYGVPNATVVVPLGTVVCWYNVGQHTHTVTGGPWGDSGPLALAWNFLWTADQVGTFPYRCTYHSPDMQATLQVVPA